MVELRVVDKVCINVNCGKPLTEYELVRQKRSRKYRFCKKCRCLRFTNAVSWKCIACGRIIDHGSYIGQYYCENHNYNRERGQRHREQNKIRARVKAFAKKHPIVIRGSYNVKAKNRHIKL